MRETGAKVPIRSNLILTGAWLLDLMCFVADNSTRFCSSHSIPLMYSIYICTLHETLKFVIVHVYLCVLSDLSYFNTLFVFNKCLE